MNCFGVRDHPSERFHGSNNLGNCLLAPLQCILQKIKELFMVTNGRLHIRSSQQQAASVEASATNEIRVNSINYTLVRLEYQNLEQIQDMIRTERRVAMCNMSNDCTQQTQTEAISDTNESSKTMTSVDTEKPSILPKFEVLYDNECPTCLEEYEAENPKIVAKCSHHFHLSCIYAWKERSDKCPMCLQVMTFDEII